jgi:hypothetical protein
MDIGVNSCVVCRHKRVADIDAAQERGDDEIRIAQQYGVTKVALRKHAAHRQAAPDIATASVEPGPIASPLAALPACPICAHPKRAEIDTALSAGDVPSKIARHHLVDIEALKEHSAKHLTPARREKGQKAKDLCDDLVRRLGELRQQAEDDEDASYNDRVRIHSAETKAIELLARLNGELGPTDEARILQTIQWRRVEARLLEALKPYPEAALAAGKALEELGGVP